MSDAYDDLQQDVMRCAERITGTIRIDVELVQRLKQRLSDCERVALTLTIGLVV
ncbi:MAG: hypothetical protein HY320_04295, partial [Armatimonadetes bacterium]|nr:hypothetical protein [Armatimonadota bacterium]